MKAKDFVSILKAKGFDFFTGVPCSILKPILNYTGTARGFTYIAATIERDAVGIASGACMAGRNAVLLMQNSGLGNVINPLTSLNMIYGIPVLMIITWRGHGKDAPEHAVMGRKTTELLDCLGIPFRVIEDDRDKTREDLTWARKFMKKTGMPAALILKDGIIEPFECGVPLKSGPGMKRKDAVKVILASARGRKALMITTTGMISREFFRQGDSAGNFYMLGSMGLASSIALGVAASTSRKVIAVDGDGSLLMSQGMISCIGHYRPGNLIHVVLDNEVYESTGCQPTLSKSVPLEKIAKEAGYCLSCRIAGAGDLSRALKACFKEKGPHFILVKVKADGSFQPPRVSRVPSGIKKRFENEIKT